jgi:hypothetical protein
MHALNRVATPLALLARQEKLFFFEKKTQKTFMFEGVMGSTQWTQY